MAAHKYFDCHTNSPIDIATDGCDLAQWARLYGTCRFARHPKGFRVFLPPDKLAACDEYADLDPYTVEQNIDSEFHRRRIELTVQLAREAVHLQERTPEVLDLGCGQGHITERVRRALAGANITGLDYSVSAIAYAHERFGSIDFSVGDAYEAPYCTGYFDVVVCNNLWEHVPDPLFLLARIKRVIRPNGHLIISTPSRYRLENLARVLRGKPVAFMSQHHVTEYTVGQVKEQLEYGGFAVKKVLSRPLPAGGLRTTARGALAKWLSLIGSHHQLEETVFYLAQNGVDGRG